MEHIVAAHNDEITSVAGPVVLAIGAFDGIHLGHQSVIKAAKTLALKHNAKSAVYTFRPHPSAVLGSSKSMILNSAQKQKRLQLLGVDYLIEQCFDEAYSRIPAEEFLLFLQRQLPQIKGVSVGQDFRFGANKEGNADYLKCIAGQLDVHIEPFVMLNNKRVSSTYIRKYLADGHIVHANEMLGYPYYLSGEVTNGRGIAHKFGFPTMNVRCNFVTLLKFGVYLVKYRFDRGGPYFFGVANYGVRPTFFDGIAQPVLEVHSIDDVGDIRAQGNIEVQFLYFIRNEQKFTTQIALKDQVRKDINIAKKKMPHFL